MHALRQAHSLTRWMLVWFALTLASAVASPLLGVQGGVQMVCTAGGIKLVAQNGDDAVAAGGFALDCPLCSTAHAPPPVAPSLAPVVVQPLAYRLQPIVAARIAALTAPPLPARGPPHFSS
ncbi:MAG: DUF2946 family protein [Burkholderiaceae bacterium]|nr:DUF2946 family protein [Burkholderiaceae bacterium]